MSDETDGPVFPDEYKDPEWEALVGQNYQRALTPKEGRRYVAGPRSHPFGVDAWCVVLDGRPAVFRNEAACQMWLRQSETQLGETRC